MQQKIAEKERRRKGKGNVNEVCSIDDKIRPNEMETRRDETTAGGGGERASELSKDRIYCKRGEREFP